MTTSPPQGGRITRGVTLLVTNSTKIGGLLIALHEILLRNSARSTVLIEAAFMMAGAQFSEHVLLAVLDRLMGRPLTTQEKQEPPSSSSREET